MIRGRTGLGGVFPRERAVRPEPNTPNWGTQRFERRYATRIPVVYVVVHGLKPTVAFLTESGDQRERVLMPVREHRFGWRSYRPESSMV